MPAVSDSQSAVVQLSAGPPAWISAGLVGLYCLAVLCIFQETAGTILGVWERSDTYAHGYLIVPISLWITWTLRSDIKLYKPVFDFRVLPLILALGFVWFLAFIVNVLVVQELAFVGILIGGIWAILGSPLTKLLAFPLGFLVLAVPMGEGLIPPLMELTARSTVWMVQATGIPVYREGMYFSLPSGNWSVVYACSGSRYLIASFTLGLIYAYLTYRSLGRRLLFMLAAIVVPILGNLLRAYMIVMIGHLSGMELATGVDHLVYGWVFFGLVMLFLFWLGSLWREDNISSETFSDSKPPQPERDENATRLLLGFSLAIVLSGFWPAFAETMQIESSGARASSIEEIDSVPPWAAVSNPNWSWQPVNPGSDRELIQFYQNDGEMVGVYIQQYLEQEQGVELVGDGERIVSEDSLWRVVERGDSDIQLENSVVSVDRWRLRSGTDYLMVWSWYRVGDRYTANPYLAKLLEAWNIITSAKTDASRLVVAIPVIDTEGNYEATLQDFVTLHLSGIQVALDRISGSKGLQ